MFSAGLPSLFLLKFSLIRHNSVCACLRLHYHSNTRVRGRGLHVLVLPCFYLFYFFNLSFLCCWVLRLAAVYSDSPSPSLTSRLLGKHTKTETHTHTHFSITAQSEPLACRCLVEALNNLTEVCSSPLYCSSRN